MIEGFTLIEEEQTSWNSELPSPIGVRAPCLEEQLWFCSQLSGPKLSENKKKEWQVKETWGKCRFTPSGLVIMQMSCIYFPFVLYSSDINKSSYWGGLLSKHSP